MDLCRFKRTVALCREGGARPAPAHPLSGTGSYLVLQALNSLLAENCSGQVPGSRRPSRASRLSEMSRQSRVWPQTSGLLIKPHPGARGSYITVSI